MPTSPIKAVEKKAIISFAPASREDAILIGTPIMNTPNVATQIKKLGINNKAGRKDKMVIIADTIPIAPIGPRPAVLDKELNNRINREIETVEPDARIGSQTPLYADFIASK